MPQIEVELIFPLAALLCAIVAAGFDLASRRIPNVVTLPALVLGVILHASVGGCRQAISSALAGLLCGLVFLVFYLAGGMGAGDVKLIAAVGCLAGPAHILTLLVATGLAGGVMAIGLALVRGQLSHTLHNMVVLAVHHRTMGLAPHPQIHAGNEQTLRLPYAPAITAGCALTLLRAVLER